MAVKTLMKVLDRSIFEAPYLADRTLMELAGQKHSLGQVDMMEEEAEREEEEYEIRERERTSRMGQEDENA